MEAGTPALSGQFPTSRCELVLEHIVQPPENINLDIFLNILLNILLNIFLNILLNILLNICQWFSKKSHLEQPESWYRCFIISISISGV